MPWLESAQEHFNTDQKLSCPIFSIIVGVSLENDPFLMEETDLGRCQALDSCLWEIQVSTHTLLAQGKERISAYRIVLIFHEFREFGIVREIYSTKI